MALTPKTKKLLVFIDLFIKNNGYAPTYEEMLSAVGKLSKGSLKAAIDRMVRDGFLARDPGRNRGLSVLHLPDALKPVIHDRVEGEVYPYEWREMKFVISPRVPDDEIWVGSAGKIHKIVNVRQ